MHDLAATLALFQQHSSLTSLVFLGAPTDAHFHSLWCRLREAREAAGAWQFEEGNYRGQTGILANL